MTKIQTKKLMFSEGKATLMTSWSFWVLALGHLILEEMNSDKCYYEAETCQCCINWSIVALFYPYPVTGHFLLPQTRCGIKWMEWDDIFFRYNSVSQERKAEGVQVCHSTRQVICCWHVQKCMKCVDMAFFNSWKVSLLDFLEYMLLWMRSIVGHMDISCPFGVAFVFKCYFLL